MKHSVAHLLDEQPIMFYPTLAILLNNVSAALVFQRLHWLLNAAKEDEREYNFVNDRWWVYNTYAKWKKKYFPWLSEKTIKNTFLWLEELGIVLSMQSVKAALDREKWYTIDYDAWTEWITATDKALLPNGQKLPDGSGKKFPMNGQKLPDDLYTKIPNKDSSSSPGTKKRRERDWLYETVMIRSFCGTTNAKRKLHNGTVVRIIAAIRANVFEEGYRATAAAKRAERRGIVLELRAAYRWHAGLRDRFGNLLHPPKSPESVWNLLVRYRAHKAGLPYSNGKSYDHQHDVDEEFYV